MTYAVAFTDGKNKLYLAYITDYRAASGRFRFSGLDDEISPKNPDRELRYENAHAWRTDARPKTAL